MSPVDLMFELEDNRELCSKNAFPTDGEMSEGGAWTSRDQITGKSAAYVVDVRVCARAS